MKLSRTQFAKVVNYISRQFALEFTTKELEDLDSLMECNDQPSIVNQATPAYKPFMTTSKEVIKLLTYLGRGKNKIEAIKCCRILTGFGLKESKEIIDSVFEAFAPDPTAVKTELRRKMFSKIDEQLEVMSEGDCLDTVHFALAGCSEEDLWRVKAFIKDFC